MSLNRIRIRILLLAAVLAAAASCHSASADQPTGQPAGQPELASRPAPMPLSGDRLIALTFDDGPHGSRTALILDELKRRGVRATFFVVGYRISRYPELLRRMAAEGHEIGNHTWNHPFLTRIPDAAIRHQVERTQAAVAAVTGLRPAVMRPPFGAINTRVSRQLTLPAILWSVESRDYLVRRPDEIYRLVTGRARPGGIVLCHDFWSAPAVGRIVDRLVARGYRFVTVSELLGFADGSVRPVPGRTYWRQPVTR
jgi:peptidoglycan/xylan/chitin deacetylase (PgdA/CDA1 family)